MDITWNISYSKTSSYLLGEEINTVKSATVNVIEDQIGIALTPGYNPRPHPMGRINEDGVGAIILDDVICTVVVDSHFGGTFADYLVIQTLDVFRSSISEINEHKNIESIKNYLKEMVQRIIQNAQQQYLEEMPGELAGETTLIILYIFNDQIFWASIGDSIIYGFENSSGTILNRDNFYFLGPKSTKFKINYGFSDLHYDKLLIATDGLPECKYGVKTLDVTTIASLLSSDLEESLRKLIIRAFEEGGEDNIGLVLINLENVSTN